MVRADWNSYFMGIAGQVATRATCDRKHVGAVIVKDKNILATGYNGSISGMPHCDEMGHMIENDHCVATIHAEANAILQAAKHGTSIDGADIYITTSPCWQCFKLIANAGIRRVFYGEFYRDRRIHDVAEKVGIELISLAKD
jgi:dCMP deaminase